MNRRWTSPPLALQITALLLAGLLVAQLVALALTVLLPPQPPPQYELADIARALAAGDAGHGDSRLLRRVLASGSPEPSGAGWLTSERSRRELAQLLGRDESDVRLYFYTPLPFAGVAGVPGPPPPRPVSSTAPRHRMVRDVQPVPVAAEGFVRVDFQVAQAGGPGGGFGGAGRFGAAGGFGGQGGATGGGSGFGVPGGFGPGGGSSPGAGAGPGSGFGAGPAGSQGGGFGQPARQGGFQPQMPGSARPGSDGPFSVGPVGSGGPANPATPSNRFSMPGPGEPASASSSAGHGAASGTPTSASSAWAAAPASGLQARPAAGAFALPSLGAAPHADFPASGAANASIGRAASSSPAAASPATPRADAAHRAASGAGPSIDNAAAAARSTVLAAPRAALTVDPAKAALPTPAAAASFAAPGSMADSAPPAPAAPATESALTSPAAPADKAAASAAAARAPGEEKAATQPPVASPERGLFGLAPAPFVVGDFVAAVRLPQGGWATVQPVPEAFPNAWQRRVILWFLIAALIVVPLGWWFSRRIVGPIAGFARAAEQLGRDPRAPVLALAGPAEVGRAAQAFNRMQNQLHSFVEDRTAMIGAISHDLRTPLTRMRFRIEDLPDELRAGMLEDVEEMEQMISSVLAFIRDASEPGAREQLDLSSIVEDVVENANFVGKDVRLEQSEHAAVDVDAIGMRRVLDNLVENAVKYGQIARVRLFVDRKDAVAEISDSGPGLPEEELDRVFQPFYRAPAARASGQRGSGLGLAVCRSIARAHGGDVRLTRGAHGLVAQLRVPLAVDFSTIP